MYQVTGKILTLFDKKATDKYEASYYVQLLGETLTIDGQVTNDLVKMKIPKTVYDSLQGEIGKEASFPLGFYVNNAGQLIKFFPKAEAENVSLSA